MLLLTFKATERKSKSAPFLRVPNGGFIITVSTIGPREYQDNHELVGGNNSAKYKI